MIPFYCIFVTNLSLYFHVNWALMQSAEGTTPENEGWLTLLQIGCNTSNEGTSSLARAHPTSLIVRMMFHRLDVQSLASGDDLKS